MIEKFLSSEGTTIEKALKLINKGGEKTIFIVDKNNLFLGTLTDGDIRRALIKGFKIKDKITKIYNKKSFFLKDKYYTEKKIKNYFNKTKFDLIPVIKNKKIIKIYFKSKLIINKKHVKKKKVIKKTNYNMIIMAGGKGSRLAPLTSVLPKPLLPINNKPIISHIIEKFEKSGIKKFIISINKNNLIIKDYIRNISNKKNIKFIEESRPLGTVGALSLIKKINQPFFVTNCDVLFDLDINKLIDKYKKFKPHLIIVTVNLKSKTSYGVCQVDKNYKLIGIKEKPTYYHNIIGGLYMFNPIILKYMPKNKKIDLDALIIKIKKNNGVILTFPISQNQWNDIGEFSSFKRTLKKLHD